MPVGEEPDTMSMNTLRTILKARRVAAVAVAVAVVPFAASTASAAPKTFKRTAVKQSTAAPATTTSVAPSTSSSAAAPVTSVIAIGGYVFYNVSYAEAVDLWLAAVAAAPAGYTPPPVTSVSVSTTVSGTVVDPGNH